MRTNRRAAFFDVDETLITAKSMFDFLRFWTLREGGDETDFHAVMGRFRSMWASGVPRTEVNLAYYRHFAGASWTELLKAGREWYEAYRLLPDAFVLPTVRALTDHRTAGDTVVLVSGSFTGCLDPLAKELGADVVLCSQPLTGPDGRLTGEVRRAMIGEAKTDAVRETLARLGADPAACSAYGDHASDLGMLGLVGRPHVVGRHDPVLTDHAVRHGWPVLPADTGTLARASR
ncbi:HAD-IB family hydrolase [Streptomyces sp. NPDC051133]|uniref:HAD family hydrolase n=1 Tax=Streptomyces sp. NPDC051133 TaxID=3155521 RepID=UPI00341AA589